jgi:hypothetical protein
MSAVRERPPWWRAFKFLLSLLLAATAALALHAWLLASGGA